jgi:hypothetical protein
MDNELIEALEKARKIEAKIHSITVSMNEDGAFVCFYDAGKPRRRMYGSGIGCTVDEAISAALWVMGEKP